MLNWIRAQLEQTGLDENSIRKVELASEEAIVNIIQHAYQQKGGEIQIYFKVIEESHIELAICDQGPPFDPLQRPPQYDPLAPLEDRPLGGLGILFIRQYMDAVHYKRDGKTNILLLIKKI